MNHFSKLWQDESGSIVSAELVLLGTLGVVGLGVGAASVGDSVDAELDEVALSIRSLDQSYQTRSFQGCGAWTAGSTYTQVSVAESRAALQERIRQRRAEAAEQQDSEAAAPATVEPRPEEARQNDEQRRERRRRMRQREAERRERDGDEKWDGDTRPQGNPE